MKYILNFFEFTPDIIMLGANRGLIATFAEIYDIADPKLIDFFLKLNF